MCVRPADHGSRAHATCSPDELCVRNLRSTGAMGAPHVDHWCPVRATSGPREPKRGPWPSDATECSISGSCGHKTPLKALKIVKSSTSSVLLQILIRVRVRGRVTPINTCSRTELVLILWLIWMSYDGCGPVVMWPCGHGVLWLCGLARPWSSLVLIPGPCLETLWCA